MSVAGSAALQDTATDVSAWLEIPKLAGRLLWRLWPALLFWFFAQRVAYDLLMDAAIRLAEYSALLSYAAIAVLIVTQLVGTIGMFLAAIFLFVRILPMISIFEMRTLLPEAEVKE